MEDALFSVKMRASQEKAHISGAEKLVGEAYLSKVCEQLLQRALNHAKGEPDEIHLKIEKVKEEVKICDALPVKTISVKDPMEGREQMRGLLEAEGVEHAEAILAYFPQCWGMRGAMLLDIDTLERLEPNVERGIRATYMDVLDETDDRTDKDHFKEALVLATKVATHPNIVAELCISDDPDYVTGYFASKRAGYVRITKVKESGSPNGGRIFLFRGSSKEAEDCIWYLEHQKMFVRMKG